MEDYWAREKKRKEFFKLKASERSEFLSKFPGIFESADSRVTSYPSILMANGTLTQTLAAGNNSYSRVSGTVALVEPFLYTIQVSSLSNIGIISIGYVGTPGIAVNSSVSAFDVSTEDNALWLVVNPPITVTAYANDKILYAGLTDASLGSGTGIVNGMKYTMGQNDYNAIKYNITGAGGYATVNSIAINGRALGAKYVMFEIFAGGGGGSAVFTMTPCPITI